MSFPESLQAVWAPWRVEYFSMDKSRDFLSEAAQSSDDRAHLVVRRLKDTFLIMNRFPYTVGHLMAVPYRKVADIANLTQGEQLELWEQAAYAQKLLRTVVRAEGFNVVPRWEGDNNFMPVLGNVRVMAESLDALYDKLVQAAG